MDDNVRNYLMQKMNKERAEYPEYEQELKQRTADYEGNLKQNTIMSGIDKIVSGIGGIQHDSGYWQNLNEQNRRSLNDFEDRFKEAKTQERLDRQLDKQEKEQAEKNDPKSPQSIAVRNAYKKLAPQIVTQIPNFDELSADDIQRNLAKPMELYQRAEESRSIREQKQAEKAAKKKELSTTQAKQKGLYEIGLEAERQYNEAIKKGKDEGYDPTAYLDFLDNASWTPNLIKNNAAIEAEAAQAAWVEAFLRDASGAAIPPSERMAYAKDFFPRPGDSEETVKNKARLRKTKMENARVASGDFSTASSPKFPMQVRKDGKVATVKNEAELQEAKAEGWK